MTGGEMAPGLTGGDFTANWNDLSLGDLFERMRISMPQNNPGSLSRQQNADILSFILQKGGYPAGEAELPGQTEVLNMYKFLAMKPGH
jgi:quinoprotein glucose dehydrogenase